MSWHEIALWVGLAVDAVLWLWWLLRPRPASPCPRRHVDDLAPDAVTEVGDVAIHELDEAKVAAVAKAEFERQQVEDRELPFVLRWAMRRMVGSTWERAAESYRESRTNEVRRVVQGYRDAGPAS